MKIAKRKIWVALGSEINSFRLAQGSQNEIREELTKDKLISYFEVSNLREASWVCQKFIEYFDLGSSNWRGGQIIDDDGKFIARVSYNGKLWDSEDWSNSKEIKL